MFSKACEYGIKAVIYIAVQSVNAKRTTLKDICKEIDSPEAFTAKILQQLTKNKIINSVKGPAGGFEIEKKNLSKIKLSHIVAAIDGEDIYKGCGLGLKECSKIKPCPVHDNFKKIRSDLRKMLESTSLLDLASDLNDGITYLKR